MNSSMIKNELFVEKYRPEKISDCILPNHLKTSFENIINTGNVPHMLLTGPSGSGKTSVAVSICKELDLQHLMINGSSERNIDTFRDIMENYAGKASINGSLKILIIDEADYLNSVSTQPALRNFMEKYYKNCRIIFTANHGSKLIEPIHSRCSSFNFWFTSDEKMLLNIRFLDRLKHILDQESINYEENALINLF